MFQNEVQKFTNQMHKGKNVRKYKENMQSIENEDNFDIEKG